MEIVPYFDWHCSVIIGMRLRKLIGMATNRITNTMLCVFQDAVWDISQQSTRRAAGLDRTDTKNFSLGYHVRSEKKSCEGGTK